MTKKSINLTNLSREYGPGYVARIEGTAKIIAHARRADTLVKKVQNKKEFKEDRVVISWIPKYGARYVFRISFRLHQG